MEWQDRRECPLEIPAQIKVELGKTEESKVAKPLALIGGTLKGVGMTAVRLTAGVLETITFNIAAPDKNYEPILNPEYVCEYFKKNE